MNERRLPARTEPHSFHRRDRGGEGSPVQAADEGVLPPGPLYGDRFSDVWLWSEWRQRRPESGPDIGIDLVAEERDGGYCAIQCKCHAPGTRIDKKALDSFISASARAPFTARIVVDTGDGWGPNAIRTLTGLEPECHVLRFGDLASRPFDWPDLVREEPEALSLRRELFRLRPHQEQAFDDVLRGFAAHDSAPASASTPCGTPSSPASGSGCAPPVPSPSSCCARPLRVETHHARLRRVEGRRRRPPPVPCPQGPPRGPTTRPRRRATSRPSANSSPVHGTTRICSATSPRPEGA